MNRPRLTYFEMRGRAEAIRLFLHATQTAFEDDRVVAADEWEALGPKLPFGGLPIYETDGALLCESHAILRYMGRKLGAATRNDLSQAELDSAHDAIAEAQEDLWRFNWVEDYYDHFESYARNTLHDRLVRLERWLSRNRADRAEWFGNHFSHVDCVAFCYLDEIDAFFPAVLAEFEALRGLHSRVASLPGVSDYLGSSARPLVFGMGRMGPKVDPRVALPAACEFANPWTEPIDLAPILRRQRRLTRLGSGPANG